MEIKILEKLKTKHQGVQASLLARIAKIYSKTVTKEDEIDAAISGSDVWVSEMALELQVETDRRVTAVQKEQDKKIAEAVAAAKAEAGGGNPPKPGDPKPDETPAWAKSLIESNKALADKVAAYETEGTQKSHLEKLTGKLKEKGIPEGFYSAAIANRTFKDEAEIEVFTTTLDTQYQAFNQSLIDGGLAGQPKPVFGAPDNVGVSPLVKEFVAERNNPTKSEDALGGKKL